MREQAEPEDADIGFVDSLVVPASLHDVDGRFIHVNDAAVRASGMPKEYWIGKDLTERITPELRDKVMALFRRAAESGEPNDFETVFVDGSGVRRSVRAQHLPLAHDGRIARVLTLAYTGHRLPPEVIFLDRDPRLTRRQREVLELIDAGFSTADIARTLSLSNETIRNYVRVVMKELRAHTRIEAVATARRLGLLAPTPLEPPAPGSG